MPGDPVRVMTADNFTVRQQLTIKSVEMGVTLPAGSPTVEEVMASEPQGKGAQVERVTFYRFTLSGPTNAVRGDVIDLPANASPNFVIRDNTFTDLRPRWLRVMASKGLIERNTIARTTGPGISLGAHYGFWREAGWVSDVVVRDNQLSDIGLGGPMLIDDIAVLGAICVWAETPRNASAEIPFAREHRNVRIVNNTIDGCSVNGISIAGLVGGEVSGNRINKTNTVEGKEAPGPRRVPQSHAIVVKSSSGVDVRDNTIRDVGEFNRGEVMVVDDQADAATGAGAR